MKSKTTKTVKTTKAPKATKKVTKTPKTAKKVTKESVNATTTATPVVDPTALPPGEDKCMWTISSACSKDLSMVEMFIIKSEFQFVPSMDQHREIMLLHKNGYDVEEVLNQTPEWRKQEALTLKLSGLDTGEVEL